MQTRLLRKAALMSPRWYRSFGVALCAFWAWQPAGSTTLDSCALLQKSDVQAAFSPRTFESGTPGPVQPGTAKLAAVASCTYTSPAPSPRDIVSVTLLTRRSPDGVKGVSMEAMKAGVVQLKGTPVDVPGLGDGAFWANLGTDSHPSYLLNVMVGTRYWLTFSTAGVKTEPQRAIQTLTGLAKRVLPRL
jgi:hypothetical protein